MTAKQLTRLCAANALAVGEMRRFELDGEPPIALYHLEDGFHATTDTCTHARANLTDGDLEGDEVVCPVHFGAFHVPSGRALCFPVTEDLRVYAVHVADGDVHVELS